LLIEADHSFDLVTAINDLVGLTGTDNVDVDVVHLNRGGPVIKERAMVGSIGPTRVSRLRWQTPPSQQSESGSRPIRCVG
jgi:hypothetical protein